MRIPVSLLALCAAFTGCNSSVDSTNADSVVISSDPTGAAIRLNGNAVGRTPTTIILDRTKNYQLQVGKGGFLTEVSELKPRLITTSAGMEFGFPAAVKVNLTKEPVAGEAGIPATDDSEFKRLAKKALGEDSHKESLNADIAATKEAAARIQASLAAREAASKERLAEIALGIAAAKSAKADDAAAQAKLAAAQLALKQATDEAAATRTQAENNLKSVAARQAALAGSETKVAVAQLAVAKAKEVTTTSLARLEQLEQSYAAEIKGLSESQASSAAAIKALNARTDGLALAAINSTAAAKAEAAKGIAEANKVAEQNLAKSMSDAEAKVAQANEALTKSKSDAEAMVAAANAKVAEANKVAAAAKAQADALKYSEFNARYALLESKRRTKAITEEEYKASLSELRKELAL